MYLPHTGPQGSDSSDLSTSTSGGQCRRLVAPVLGWSGPFHTGLEVLRLVPLRRTVCKHGAGPQGCWAMSRVRAWRALSQSRLGLLGDTPGCQGPSCSNDKYTHTYTQQQSLCPKVIIIGYGFRHYITSIHGLGQDSSHQPGTLFPK